MDRKMAKITRDAIVERMADVDVAGYTYIGRGSEGAVFGDGTDTIVIRVIVKAEGTDANKIVADYDAKVAKAAAKAKEKADKVAKAEAAKVETEAE